jgi:hypothetical protein
LLFDGAKLAFADHVHDLDASDQDSGAAKGLESEHRPGDAFDGAVVLLDDVVEVLGLAHHDGQAAVSLNARDSRGVGAALVDGDLFGHAVQADGAFEECPGGGVISLGLSAQTAEKFQHLQQGCKPDRCPR